MSFAPVIPFGGYTGWSFLKRTQAQQKAAYEKSPQMARDIAYFREKIGTIKTAEALVKDRRLLSVALGAFGLDADINNKYFIRKVLEDGTLDTSDLANKLSNKQYQEMSKTFGFGDYATPSTQLSDFADKIIARYKERQFEVAVGNTDNSMRLALNARRELATLAAKTSSADTKWFTIMGSEPLREVFETALGLPASFSSLDIDQQLETLKAKTKALMGSDAVSQFSDTAKVEKLLRSYLVRDEISNGTLSSMTKGYGALMVLQAR